MDNTDGTGKPLPPRSTQAQQGDFGVMQISTTDPAGLWAAWSRATPGAEIQTQSRASRNEVIQTFIVFHGCTPDARGHCNVTASFEVIDPSGKSYAKQDDAPLIDGAPPPKGMLGLGIGSLGLRIEDGELLGDYRVLARTTDHVAGITLLTEETLAIVEAPAAGGWKSIANPDADPKLRPVAQAAISRIPRKGSSLARIERAEAQVVAGTNYRLILRLEDGSRWTATVWQKLDGTLEVRGVAEVR